jgi:lipopolysaccharide transport system ATP-binding protein
MSDIAIKFENISKQYRLGKIGTGTISHDLNRWWARVRCKEDPYLKIGQENILAGTRHAVRGTRDSESSTPRTAHLEPHTAHRTPEFIWALKDINLEVKQGEVLGIIGKNGAGKSTLLKILSRVTTPTTGIIKARGRIASLLEVGTGFHPEMTGRENIFMNGSIMGMTKAEIKSKFDEIVDFAGVETYIDTPVKRYSSGMTVRLGFAIAAHLEPEILVVDEVLAVGDAEFQKKAIGKMQDVSRSHGRTVLFVSHNMAAIRQLCTLCMVLDCGFIKYNGNALDSVNYYQEFTSIFARPVVTGNKQIRFKNFSILDKDQNPIKSFCTFDEVIFLVNYKSFSRIEDVTFSVCFNNDMNQRVTSLWTSFTNEKFRIEEGDFEIRINVSAIHLIPGVYELILYAESNGIVIERVDSLCNIIVGYTNKFGLVQIPSIEQGTFVEQYYVKIEQYDNESL